MKRKRMSQLIKKVNGNNRIELLIRPIYQEKNNKKNHRISLWSGAYLEWLISNHTRESRLTKVTILDNSVSLLLSLL
jgi:hypothetical protein